MSTSSTSAVGWAGARGARPSWSALCGPSASAAKIPVRCATCSERATGIAEHRLADRGRELVRQQRDPLDQPLRHRSHPHRRNASGGGRDGSGRNPGSDSAATGKEERVWRSVSSTSWSSAQGRSGEVCAGRLADGGLEVALVEERPDRRRVLLLRLHAVEGAAAPRPSCSPRCGASPAPREAVRRRARRRGRAGAPRRGDPRPRRLEPASLARGQGHRAGARPRGARRRAPRRRRRRRAERPQGGRRQHRHDGGDAPDRRAARRRAVDQPRGDDREERPREPRRARRRAGRRRAGAGLVHARGDASRSSRPRTACFPQEEPFAGERGRRRPARDRCRRPHRARRRARVSARGRRGHGRARGRRAAARRASCWSRSGAAPRTERARPRRRPGSRPTRRGYLEVDDQLRVGGSDWLYAVGDVNGRALLTHMGKYQARIAADAILGKDVAGDREDRAGPPRVIFTEPQVAAVGLTLEKARASGIDARAVDVPTAATAGASFIGKDAAGHHAARRRRAAPRRSSARRSSAPRSPTSCTRRRSPSSARCRWSGCGTRSRAFPTRSEVWLKLLEEYGL